MHGGVRAQGFDYSDTRGKLGEIETFSVQKKEGRLDAAGGQIAQQSKRHSLCTTPTQITQDKEHFHVGNRLPSGAASAATSRGLGFQCKAWLIGTRHLMSIRS